MLEEKLARILEEFGVDKLADVLDSEEAACPSRSVLQAMIAPEDAEQRAAGVAEEIGARRRKREQVRVCSMHRKLDPSAAQHIAGHQMPYWTERLTLGFLRTQEWTGASAKPAAIGVDLRWPNGDTSVSAVFDPWTMPIVQARR